MVMSSVPSPTYVNSRIQFEPPPHCLTSPTSLEKAHPLPRVPNVSQECDKIYVLKQAPEKHEAAAATLALEQDRERTIVEDLTSKVDLQPT